jgi:hypothetical protein
MSIQYLLDENIPPRCRDQLAQRDPMLIVWRVGDPGVPPLQSPDPLILEWCAANRFILVTRNRHSMPRHLAEHMAAGRHVPGIFVVVRSLSLGHLLDELLLIAGASFENEHQDQIHYLPIS